MIKSLKIAGWGKIKKYMYEKCASFKILMRYDVYGIISELYQIKLIKSYICFDQKNVFSWICVK